MPWKDGYTTSDEKSLADRQVIWPDGKQCAYVLVVDLSVASGPEGITPADLTTAASQFSTQVGLRSLLDALQHFGITATFAVPAVIAEISPATVEAIMAHGHEVAAHGFKHEDVSQLDKDQEQERLEAATASLTRLTGQRPAGWYSLPRQRDPFAVGTISPHTIDLLLNAGYKYMGNGLADDIPYYWVTDVQTPRAMLTLPYYYHFNDQYFLMFPPPGLGSGLENPRPFLTNCTLVAPREARVSGIERIRMKPVTVTSNGSERLRLKSHPYQSLASRYVANLTCTPSNRSMELEGTNRQAV